SGRTLGGRNMGKSRMLSAGCLLIQPVVRPPHVSAELIPPTVISASDCISPQFPGPYAISWCLISDDERARSLVAVGIPAEKHAHAIAWATEAFDTAFGWPGVFYSLEEARETRDRIFAVEPGI